MVFIVVWFSVFTQSIRPNRKQSKIESKMEQKILMGVAHRDEEELALVVDKMREYNPRIIGLELPENYVKRELLKVSYFFFNDLAKIARDENREVIPLESSELFDYIKSIFIAKRVVQGQINRKKLKAKVADYTYQLKDCHNKPPEIIYQPYLRLAIFQKALDILNQERSLEDVLTLWDDGNRQREEYVKKNIDKNQPDLVIIGDEHAKKLREVLPYYKYITTIV